MYYEETEGTRDAIVYENIPIEDINGGKIIDTSELEEDCLSEGAVIGVDASGIAHVVKTAKLQADATGTATAYRIDKRNNFKVGDRVSVVDPADPTAYVSSQAITEIDKDNAAYDEITLGATLGEALTAADGVAIVEVTASDVFKYEPVGMSFGGSNTKYSNADVAIATRATVREEALVYPVDSVIKAALTSRFMFIK